MNNRLFGFLVLPLCLAGLMGLSAVDTACTPAPRKASHGGIMVEWEDAQLLAPGGYARVHRLNDGSYMAVYSRGGNGCFKISNDGCRTWSPARTAMTNNSYSAPVSVNVSNAEFAQLSNSNPYRPGRIIYAANIRPSENQSSQTPYTIAISTSDDIGKT